LLLFSGWDIEEEEEEEEVNYLITISA